MSPEPVLCFDGDAAGQRAAARALRRALPLLRPGQSLRFAALPAGEDPDSLIEQALANGDEHVIKFTEACLARHALAPSPAYPAAVAQVLTLIGSR